jgi:hypothetical protein
VVFLHYAHHPVRVKPIVHEVDVPCRSPSKHPRILDFVIDNPVTPQELGKELFVHLLRKATSPFPGLKTAQEIFQQYLFPISIVVEYLANVDSDRKSLVGEPQRNG